MGPAPAQLANNIDNSGRDTRILVRIHESFLDLGPCCAQGLGVDERQSVQRDERLLSNIRVTVVEPRQQICKR